MRHIFVSQNIIGKTEKEIERINDLALHLGEMYFAENVKIKEFACDIKDPFFVEKTISALNDSDAVYFAEGWQESGLCRMHMAAALSNDVHIL